MIKLGDEAEHFFLSMQSKGGLEHTQVDNIKHAMAQLASTAKWPLHRYPWPQLRQQLLLGLLGLEKYSEALLHSAIFVRIIHPIMFEQAYHPIRLVQMWTFWNICRHCLGTATQRQNPREKEQNNIRWLGLLGCVMIEHIRGVMCDGMKEKGKLENIMEQAYQNVTHEGGFWEEYQQNPEKIRNETWAWIDDKLAALLREEGVSQDILNSAISVTQG